MDAEVSTLSFDRILPASPRELFDAWMDGNRMSKWFHLAPGVPPLRVEVDARPGGGFALAYELAGTGSVSLRGRWRSLQPARGIDFDLELESALGRSNTLVHVELQENGNTTRMRLRHSGVPAWQRPQSEASWRHCLNRVVSACPAAMQDFTSRLDHQPRFRSRFGGFWPDLSDAEARLEGKRELGLLDDVDAARFRHWMQHGYVLLEGAVPPARIDEFRAEIAKDWRRGNANLTIELNDGSGQYPRMAPQYEKLPHKVLDYHSVSRGAREVQFAPAIRRFLGQLFERPPMAFQSLLFRYGTQQEMHQDTAYVVVESPMQFVGCWVAMEDIVPGSGELHYYGGSHRIPEYLWLGSTRACPPGYNDHGEFLAWVRDQSERAGCPLIRFHPKKGDALVWHADLVHGGSKRELKDRTRWSYVSHYCPVDVDPEWMARTRHSGRVQHAPGCYYCFQHRE